MSASSAAEMLKAMEAAFGPNSGEEMVTSWLDTGYDPLNKIISGHYESGWPGGRIIEIYGPSASGKTVLATLAMIAAQKAGGIAIFIDWERAFNAEFARMMGLNTEFPYFVYKRPKTWEEGNTMAVKIAEFVRSKKLIPETAPIVAVFDSIAAAIPRSVLEKGIDEYTMNDTSALARVTSTTLKAINQFVSDFDFTAIYLNQIRTKIGIVFGDPTTTPGGGAMEFYASVRLATGSKKIMEAGDGGKEFKGRLIGIETKKNKLAMPFQEIDLRLIYDEDGKCRFDFTYSLLDHLISMGKLTADKKTGRVTWIDGKVYHKKMLSAMIDTEGRYPELKAMLLA